MLYYSSRQSPLGKILLAADENALCGLWFSGQKFSPPAREWLKNEENPIFDLTGKWLDIYFSGHEPDFKLPLRFGGSDFQHRVWQILCEIPYGKTVTYGWIAKHFNRMAAQAVGRAVGRNPVSIIVPCHRVIAANGSSAGYAGGIEKKLALLKLEKSVLF